MGEAKGRVFLIHWNAGEVEGYAEKIRGWGWAVETEAEDGARGGKAIIMNPPQAVVIYLTRLPSHGRETAHYLKERKSTRDIPVIFVGGEADKIEAVRAKVPGGVYVEEEDLRETLEGFRG